MHVCYVCCCSLIDFCEVFFPERAGYSADFQRKQAAPNGSVVHLFCCVCARFWEWLQKQKRTESVGVSMWCRLARQRWWTSRVGLSQLQTCSAFVSDYSTRGVRLISVGIWKCARVVLHPVRCDWTVQTEIAPGCHSLELDYPSSSLMSVSTNPSLSSIISLDPSIRPSVPSPLSIHRFCVPRRKHPWNTSQALCTCFTA